VPLFETIPKRDLAPISELARECVRVRSLVVYIQSIILYTLDDRTRLIENVVKLAVNRVTITLDTNRHPRPLYLYT